MFFDQDTMKATIKENSFNKYQKTTMHGPALKVIHFDKIAAPSAALLYPAYKNNNQMHDGLGHICPTWMYCLIGNVKLQKFQTGIFVEWKTPLNLFRETIPRHLGCHRFRAWGSLQFFVQCSFTCSLPALIIWGILVTCCFNIATHHRSTFISIPIMPPSTMDYCNTWKNQQIH